MPQELVCIYEKATGKPLFAHSVDAAEAVRLGDYVSTPPADLKPTDDDLRRAMQQASGIGTASHPELQTPEERQQHRDEANRAEAVRQQQAAAVLHPIVTPLVPGVAPVLEPRPPAPPPDVTRSTAVGASTEAEKPATASSASQRGAERK